MLLLITVKESALFSPWTGCHEGSMTLEALNQAEQGKKWEPARYNGAIYQSQGHLAFSHF